MRRSLSDAYIGQPVVLKSDSSFKKAWVSNIKIIGGKKHILVTHEKGLDQHGLPILQTDEWVIPVN